MMQPTIPHTLRVNLKTTALGISPAAIRFSWRVPTGRQTAYRIRVFRGARADDILCDTDRTESTDCVAVRVPALDGKLTAPALYAWQVAVRLQDGTETDFSEPSVFFTDDGQAWDAQNGLAVPHGIWPPHPAAVGDGEQAGVFGFVRQTFTLTDADFENLDRLILTAAGRSPEQARQYVYTLSVNGHTLGVGPSRYGKTADGKTVLYTQSFDATPYLVRGDNTVAAVLSSTADPAVRMFACRGLAFGHDGTVTSVLKPDGWQGLDGTAALRPRFSIGTGYFRAFASDMDGRVYPFGFDRPDFDAHGWLPCADKGRITAPFPSDDGTSDGADLLLCPSGCDTVTRIPLTDPRPRLLKQGEGHWLVDLGQEIVGSLALDVPDILLPPDTEITLYYGEQCRQAQGADGTWVKWDMNTSNRYRQQWVLVPGRTFETVDFMTFRYAELVGVPFELTADCVRGVAVRRAFDGGEATLTSDNPLLNDLYALTRHTVEHTTQDIYVDSQSRERGAYEGDLLINALAAYSFEDDYATARFSMEYLYTHRTWPADYILWILEAAVHDYTVTGDDTSLRTWYPVLRDKTFTRFLSDEWDLLHSGNPASAGTDAVLVDWPHTERDGYDMKVTYNTVLNCVAAAGYDALSAIARVLGEADDEKRFAALSARVKRGILTHLYDAETGTFADGLYEDGRRSPHVSQHTAAYALYAGVYADAAMADRIADAMWARCQTPDADGSLRGHIRMSVYGAFFLLMGLYKTGHADKANALLLDEHDTLGERTYAYMLRRSVGEDVSPFGVPVGATLTTEAWNRVNKPNMTYSHPWGAAVAACIVRGIFGIVPTAPGYRRVAVHPGTAGLGKGCLTLPTLQGVIKVSFDNSQPGGGVKVEAPAGTDVTLP